MLPPAATSLSSPVQRLMALLGVSNHRYTDVQHKRLECQQATMRASERAL
jgi:hypothetical protein